MAFSADSQQQLLLHLKWYWFVVGSGQRIKTWRLREMWGVHMCHLSRPPNYRGWGAIRGRHLQLHQSWSWAGQKIKLSHLMMPIFQSQTDWNEHTKPKRRQRATFGFIEVIFNSAAPPLSPKLTKERLHKSGPDGVFQKMDNFSPINQKDPLTTFFVSFRLISKEVNKIRNLLWFSATGRF